MTDKYHGPTKNRVTQILFHVQKFFFYVLVANGFTTAENP